MLNSDLRSCRLFHYWWLRLWVGGNRSCKSRSPQSENKLPLVKVKIPMKESLRIWVPIKNDTVCCFVYLGHVCLFVSTNQTAEKFGDRIPADQSLAKYRMPRDIRALIETISDIHRLTRLTKHKGWTGRCAQIEYWYVWKGSTSVVRRSFLESLYLDKGRRIYKRCYKSTQLIRNGVEKNMYVVCEKL